MKKKIWDLYAPIYALVMRSDRKVYKKMYERIGRQVAGKDVLEVATGPGLLAKQVSAKTNFMIASDYSEGMIRQAQKGSCPSNLRFEVADASCLPYRDEQFDVVIIASALHIMPRPELALAEIKRVLRPDGLLICPNFINHDKGKVWRQILRLAGISFAHQWNKDSYLEFLQHNGWHVSFSEYLPARIPLMYAECQRRAAEK